MAPAQKIAFVQECQHVPAATRMANPTTMQAVQVQSNVVMLPSTCNPKRSTLPLSVCNHYHNQKNSVLPR